MIGGYNRSIPPVTKNLLIINVLFFIATFAFQQTNIIDLTIQLGAFFPESVNFKPWQIITHMFMHGGLGHIFFNMFALWMFGSTVEQAIGPKKYLFLYFFAGLGAYSLYTLYNYFDVITLKEQLTAIGLTDFSYLNHLELDAHQNFRTQIENFKYPASTNEMLSLSSELGVKYFIPMVGASGALYGVLVAFGMLYPNAQLMLLFPPIPMKAKYFIPILILIELFQQYQNNPQDNVAHLAHLGGALFGFIFIRKWKKNRFRVN